MVSGHGSIAWCILVKANEHIQQTRTSKNMHTFKVIQLDILENILTPMHIFRIKVLQPMMNIFPKFSFMIDLYLFSIVFIIISMASEEGFHNIYANFFPWGEESYHSETLIVWSSYFCITIFTFYDEVEGWMHNIWKLRFLLILMLSV